jgi:hypothetical protein
MCASPEQGGEAGARDMALSEANKKCASLGRSIDAATMTALMIQAAPLPMDSPSPRVGSATVYFSCK